jgi:hypothetical protein
MKIIKEIIRRKESVSDGVTYIQKARCVVRSNVYCSTYDHISELVEEAKASYPYLKDNDINIVRYGGIHYANTMGIEFSPITDEVIDGWNEIDRLEFTK